MIAGPSADDRYRMVEDEFLSTAQRFTNHLHRAEYARLKLMVKSQNAAAIREIERPVVGHATAEASRRHQDLKRVGKQQNVMQESGNDPDGSDLPWMGTSLQGLMETPKREFPSLAPATGGAKLRVAAGSQSNMSDQQDSRLGDHSGSRELQPQNTRRSDLAIVAPGSRNTPPAARTTKPIVSQRDKSMGQSAVSPSAVPRTPQRTGQSVATTGSSKHHNSLAIQRSGNRDASGTEDEEEDDPFGLHKRKIRREQSREQMRRSEHSTPLKKLSRDTIPSFL